MATITLRNVKGSPLTHTEVDDNFSSLKVGADIAEAGTSDNNPNTLVKRDAAGKATLSTLEATQDVITNSIGQSAAQQHTVPAVASDTLTLNAATQTLTNKTLTSPVITGGSINNTPIGGTTRNSGNFTTVDANSTIISASTVQGTRIISTVATGTAPLTVTSTTKVANLNADLLDDMTTASVNTASTIVNRDASGNFSAGAVTLTGVTVTGVRIFHQNQGLNFEFGPGSGSGDINRYGMFAPAGKSIGLFGDNISVTGSFNANGNVTLGTNTGNVHTVNGALTITGQTTVDGGLLLARSGGEAQVMAAKTGAGASGFYIYNNSTQQGLYDTVQQSLIAALKTGEVTVFAGSGVRQTALSIGADRSFSRVIPGGSTLYPDFACRAWVNFNGQGTVAIRASGNVTSVTDLGTGSYQLNFTAAMPDANYAVVGTSKTDDNTTRQTTYAPNPYDYTTTSVKLLTHISNATATDTAINNVAIFR